MIGEIGRDVVDFALVRGPRVTALAPIVLLEHRRRHLDERRRQILPAQVVVRVRCQRRPVERRVARFEDHSARGGARFRAARHRRESAAREAGRRLWDAQGGCGGG